MRRELFGGRPDDFELPERWESADDRYDARDILNDILAQHTGRPKEQIEKDTDRDKYLAANEAREYGLIDEVIESKKTADAAEAAGA